jgi:HEAT repeat protein
MPLINRPPSGAGPAPPPLDVDAALTSASADERWAAARAARGPGSVPALSRALLNESDRRVREALFTALAAIATPEAASSVARFIRSDDAGIRAGALDALRAMPGAAKPLLLNLLTDADPDTRLLACDLARDIAGADAMRLLCELLESEPETNVCAAAVETLAEVGDASALPSLRRCAARFPRDPFLGFAVQATIDRLRAGGAGSGG